MNPASIVLTAFGAGFVGYLVGSFYTQWRVRSIHEMVVNLANLHGRNVELAAAADRDRSIVETIAQMDMMGFPSGKDDEEDPSIN